MKKQLRTSPQTKRQGFTLIELLVVISIIATLAALITPAVQSARRAARNIECVNNLRNLATAVINFDTQQGHLPYAHSNVKNADSWIMQILPNLDSKAIADKMAATADASRIGAAHNLYLKVLACPDDTSADQIKGATSYVANVGCIDDSIWTNVTRWNHHPDNASLYNWNGGSGLNKQDRQIFLAAGVFHRPTGVGISNSLERIESGDGTSRTIMLAENIQGEGWADNILGGHCFGLQMTAFTASSKPLGSITLGGPSYINKNKDADEKKAPRPSSNHVGNVNTAFCDGTVRSLSENINQGVYERLISSGGYAFGQSTVDDDSAITK